MADLFEGLINLDWCMGKGCQHLCCSQAVVMHPQLCTPPRPFVLPTSPLRQNGSRSSAFKRLVFYDNDDDDNDDNNGNENCPQQLSTFSSPSCSDTEDDEHDEEVSQDSRFSVGNLLPSMRQPAFSDVEGDGDRAVTPLNVLAKLETFIDFVEQLRTDLLKVHHNQPKPEQAILLLHEKFGGKTKAVLSSKSKILLTKASSAAKQTMKSWSKKKFEASLMGSNKFDCKTCNNKETRFKTREGAMLHYRNIHDNFKPYPCEADAQCAHHFARRTDLRLHLIRKHEPNRPFTCKVPHCEKGFASSCEMKRHLAGEHKDLLKALCGEGKITKAMFAPKQHPSKRVRCDDDSDA
ncbi:hypothetical protein BASA81_001541 [Batrachochytrium salamandrivorans]|nr:hypothetical protein BASA81_001541 [Batrachochytrium salamandrivorans]